jgi:hypothetical protein
MGLFFETFITISSLPRFVFFCAGFNRVEDVLGKRWVHHVEGQRLKTETDQFRDRLQPTRIFQNWLTDAHKVPNDCLNAKCLCPSF